MSTDARGRTALELEALLVLLERASDLCIDVRTSREVGSRLSNRATLVRQSLDEMKVRLRSELARVVLASRNQNSESRSPDGDGPYAERGKTGDLQSVSTPLATQRRIEAGSEPADSHSPSNGVVLASPLGWEPIEHANGEFIIGAWLLDGEYEVGELSREGDYWFDIVGAKREPTHWQPLPIPPVVSLGDREPGTP